MLIIALSVFVVLAVLFGLCLFFVIRDNNKDAIDYDDDYDDEIDNTDNDFDDTPEDDEPDEDTPQEAAPEEPKPAADVSPQTADVNIPQQAVPDATPSQPESEPEPVSTHEATYETKGFTDAEMLAMEAKNIQQSALKYDEIVADEEYDAEDYEEDDDSEGGHKKLVIIASVAAVLVIVLTVAAIIFVLNRRSFSKPDDEDYVPENMVLVTVQDISQSIDFKGTIKPDESNLKSMRFIVDGEISDVKVKEGDFVKSGSVLCTVDSSEIKSLISKKNAELEEASKPEEIIAVESISVSADSAGVVSAIYVSDGDTVKKGDKIADIICYENASLSADFHSPISKGDSVSINSKGNNFTGTVTGVSESADDDDETVYTAKITFSAPDPALTVSAVYEGESVTANVEKGTPTTITLTAGESGQITDVYIRKNTVVNAETTIASIEAEKKTNQLSSAAQARVDSLKQEIKNLESDLENYTLKASCDCYISKIEDDVKAGGKATVGLPAIEYYEADTLKLHISLSEEDADKLQYLPANAKFKVVRTDILTDEVWSKVDTNKEYSATLESVGPDPDNIEGCVGEAVFKDDQTIFRSGMKVRGSVTFVSSYGALTIPSEAVKDNKVKVWRGAGAEEVEVKVGSKLKDGYIEILEGIERTDKIVLD